MYKLLCNLISLARITVILSYRGVLFNFGNRGKRLAKALQELGPSFIKLGQTLSVRSDLVGEKVAAELTELQDDLPPFSYKKVRKVIKKELGKEIEELYDLFEKEPVAAASIAQVHRAQTKDGKDVAVKVLRPGIERKFKRDIEFFYFAAKFISMFGNFKRLKLVEVVRTLENTTKKELDLRMEAAAASKLKHNCSKDSGIYVPSVFWNCTSLRVLTIEWVKGIPVNDKKALKAAGFSMKELSKKLAIAFFNQAYRDGFFHADIHPGNLFVNDKGDIVPVDFGIMGQLSTKDRFAVAEILKGFLKADYELVARAHLDAGYIPRDTNLHDFALAARAIGEPILGLPVEEISVAKLLSLLFKVTEDFNMETQPQLLLLQKTMVLIEGVGQKLYHKVNMWQLAEPWIDKSVKTHLSAKAKFKEDLKSLKTVFKNLPERIIQLDTAIQNNSCKKEEIEVNTSNNSYYAALVGWSAFFGLLLFEIIRNYQ